MFFLTKTQIITLVAVAAFFTGNDMVMNYFSDASSVELSRVGEKVASFKNVGSGDVYADTEQGNKIVLPPKPENAPKPNFTIYESKILNRDSPMLGISAGTSTIENLH